MTEDLMHARRDTLASSREWRSLDTVASALALTNGAVAWIYVGRRGDTYRGSFACRGDAYPRSRAAAPHGGAARAPIEPWEAS